MNEAIQTTAARPRKRKVRRTAPAEQGRTGLPPRRRQNPWIGRLLLFATCVLALDGVFGERSFMERIRARQDYEAAEQAVQRLRQENAALREKVRSLTEDASAVEAVARKELGLIRPGEILFTVRDASRH